jgi:hypothetical protein
MSTERAFETQSWIAANRKWLLGIILSLYLLITMGYGMVNPLFEAPDEHHHFFTANYIAENGRLPIADLQNEKLRQEAAQPPLYYLLGSLLTAPLESTQIPLWHNPQANIGDASSTININWAVHTSDENFPWQESALAPHLLRLLSTFLGLGTLLCIYGSGRLIWPQQPVIALLAASLTAFLPQFNFLHSAITNDTLVIFLCSAALWQLLFVWQNGVTNGRLLLLGFTVGLAVLSKNAGTLLLIYTLGSLLLIWLKDSRVNQPQSNLRFQSLFVNILIFLVPAILLGGWLWLRNWQLYHDITAANMFVAFAGGNRHATILQVLSEWRGLWPSMFAIFGWFNLRPPAWLYWIWNGLVIGALVGWVYGLFKNRRQKTSFETQLNLNSFIFNLQQPWFIALWLAAWVAAVYAGLLLFMLKTEAAQGRLLFPAILPLSLALAYGWSRFHWNGVYVLPPLLALFTTLYSLFFVIQPAYAPPPALANLPPQVEPLTIDLGHGLQLLGADIETKTAVPGDTIWLTLYWQAATPLEESPEFTLEILGHELERVAQVQGYHGRGLYPASLWPTEQIIADRFAIRLEEPINTPVLAALFTGLVGEESRATVGELEIEPMQWPVSDDDALARLGDGIELTAVSLEPAEAQPGDSVTVSVQWRITAPQAQTFTTLVHLLPPEGVGQPPLATGDNQPLAGKYPTHLWEAGELIDDSYTLVVPEDIENGRYPIVIGLYDANTFARLPVTVNNETVENGTFPAGWLTIHE